MNSLSACRRIVATAAGVPLAARGFAVSGAGQVVSRPASKPGGGSIY